MAHGRLPEDGKTYHLPAGFGRFPLHDARLFREALSKDGFRECDIILPMYDREATYLELQVDRFDFTNPQRAFAVRPYVGGINAISRTLITESKSKVEEEKIEKQFAKESQ